ncbi:MAG: hypothetical protein IT352_17130, partial [Gemmatimonadales bacterium]|nr:hypothetical protein [Gemmatimonadales bacterium]
MIARPTRPTPARARSTLLLGLAALVAVSACKKGEDEKTESETSGADSTAQAAGG